MSSTLNQQALDQIVEQIVKVLDPEKNHHLRSVCARGGGADSAVDLAVIVETDLPRGRRILPLAETWPRIELSTDILVFTPVEWERWKTTINTIPNEASREGRVLYERVGGPALVP